MSKAEDIIEVIEARIFDAQSNLDNTEYGHPMEDARLGELRALQKLKNDLKRSNLWVES